MVEYVKFSGSESLYGQKRFLHSELDILSLLKRIKNFKSLRKQELALRIALKNKVGEAFEGLQILEKLLPHARLPKSESQRDSRENAEEKSKILTLDQEVEMIRRKLEGLERNSW